MSYIPDGFTTVTPHLIANGADAAIALYGEAFGAELISRLGVPDDEDKVMHAMVQVGSAKIFISDPMPFTPREAPTDTPSSVAFYLYFENVDAVYAQAVAAGMTGESNPEDMPWGDRTGVVSDRFGYIWTIATKQRDVPPEEIMAAMKNGS